MSKEEAAFLRRAKKLLIAAGSLGLVFFVALKIEDKISEKRQKKKKYSVAEFEHLGDKGDVVWSAKFAAPKKWDGKSVKASFVHIASYLNLLHFQRMTGGNWKEAKRWFFYDEGGVKYKYQGQFFDNKRELIFDEKLWFPSKDKKRFDQDRIFAVKEFMKDYEGSPYGSTEWGVYIPTDRFDITELGDEISEIGRKVYVYPRWEFVQKSNPDFKFVLRGEPKVMEPESNKEIVDAFGSLINHLGGYSHQTGSWSRITDNGIVDAVKDKTDVIHQALKECIRVLPAQYEEEITVRADPETP